MGWFYAIFMACFMPWLWHVLFRVCGMFVAFIGRILWPMEKGCFWDGFGSKWRVLELPRSSLARYCMAGL